MGNISNRIEMYLKVMLDRAHDGVLEIQRSELADVFDCVPSQINYVLNTRFTPAHGYVVETQRGGRGFLRIIRLNLVADIDFREFFEEFVGEELLQNQSEGLLQRLVDEDVLTKREGIILKQITGPAFFNELGLREQDLMRAKIIQEALAAVMRKDV